jgi:hypothetical protein
MSLIRNNVSACQFARSFEHGIQRPNEWLFGERFTQLIQVVDACGGNFDHAMDRLMPNRIGEKPTVDYIMRKTYGKIAMFVYAISCARRNLSLKSACEQFEQNVHWLNKVALDPIVFNEIQFEYYYRCTYTKIIGSYSPIAWSPLEDAIRAGGYPEEALTEAYQQLTSNIGFVAPDLTAKFPYKPDRAPLDFVFMAAWNRAHSVKPV